MSTGSDPDGEEQSSNGKENSEQEDSASMASAAIGAQAGAVGTSVVEHDNI